MAFDNLRNSKRKSHILFTYLTCHKDMNIFTSYIIRNRLNLGIVTADVPFRRAESKYSVEQVGVIVEFFGGKLNGVTIQRVGLVLGMLHLLCSSSSDTFGMVLEPCLEMSSLVYDPSKNKQPPNIGRLITSISPHVPRMDLLVVEKVAQKRPQWISDKIVYLQWDGIQSQLISMNTIGFMATQTFENGSKSGPT
ncbi:hypothetical protein R6Q59_025120 [Mikania micrantha]